MSELPEREVSIRHDGKRHKMILVLDGEDFMEFDCKEWVEMGLSTRPRSRHYVKSGSQRTPS